MNISRPRTGYQTKRTKNGDRLTTYHQINGMWGEQLWCEGEWAIYRYMKNEERPTWAGAYAGYGSVLVHSRIWEEELVVHKDSAAERGRWRDENETVEPGYFTTEKIENVCHTQIYPVHENECHSCRAPIPDGAVAMWKMLNWKSLEEA